MASRALFVTQLYTALLEDAGLLADLERAALALAASDAAGQTWCKNNKYNGYTSYDSFDDVSNHDPAFARLSPILNDHVSRFGAICGFDMPDRPLKRKNLWVNVMRKGCYHGSHSHPQSAVSGTLYVSMPKGSGGLQLEDPRLGQMMAAPKRSAAMPEAFLNYVTLNPQAGQIHLWESWLRHEVLMHKGKDPRVSISFNYR